MRKYTKTTNPIDMKLFFTVLILVIIGTVMVFSASGVIADQKFGDPLFFLKRQILWVIIGSFAMVLGSKIRYEVWQRFAAPILLFSFFLIVLVLIPGIGVKVGGARRWLRLGFIGIQPSEFAKLSIIIYTASWIHRKHELALKNVLVYIPKVIMIGMMLLLIFKEPDLGTTVLITATIVTMHFVGGLRVKYLLGIFFVMLPGLMYAILSSSYRRTRFFSFLNPWADSRGAGYQVVQSLLAIGSGGITGVGLGNSKLKLLYLPEAHTDFIYPILSEELGLIGSLGVIGLFVFLCVRGIRISLRAPDMFGRMLGFGLTIVIMYQAIINIGVVTGLMPTKGMPLPFISFGGSSLVIMMFSVGIILNISKYARNKR